MLIALDIALIAAIVIGVGVAFFTFVIGPILLLIGWIFGWDKEDKKETSADEK